VLLKLEIMLQRDVYLVNDTNRLRGLAQGFLFTTDPSSDWLPRIHYERLYTVNQMQRKRPKFDPVFDDISDEEKEEKSQNVNNSLLYF
jgi:hypothetical protein